MIHTFIRFVNLILAGLLAGTSFGIWFGLNPKNYSASTYIEQQQNLVISLNSIMVSMVVLATMVTVLSAFFNRKSRRSFTMLLIAAAFFAVCILISRFGNLPIQKEMLTWNVDQLPDHWTLLRDKWWQFHILRTISELIALVLVSWSSAESRTVISAQ